VIVIPPIGVLVYLMSQGRAAGERDSEAPHRAVMDSHAAPSFADGQLIELVGLIEGPTASS
jgi:hypothetical protein